VRCGRRLVLTPRVTELHRHGEPPAMPRDVEWERRFTTEAARAVGVDPAGFIAFSEARILAGPLRRGYERDMLMEAREEFSDARNYLCWRAQQLVASGDATGLPAVGELLARLLLLWHDLDQLDAPES